ncbi:hypothetical protein C8R47DRAFT_969249 [Mycena vitilis]|nr:hypothetical protein C8R47DRAFT_969249 [Mycena vitilis]
MAHTTNIPDDIFDSASSCSEPRSPVSASGSSGSPGPDRPSNPRSERHHPYDKPAKTGTKTSPKSNRKMWHHALERPLFNIMELTTLGSPQRRPIYIASLEAHIDRLHTQLLG